MLNCSDFKSVLYVFFVVGCFSFTLIEALQCYDCYNCKDDEDFTGLQICDEFPVTSTLTTTTTTTTTTTQQSSSTSLSSSNADDTDIEYNFEELEESLELTTKRTTTRPTNTRSTKRSRTTTTSTTTTRDDGIEDLNWEDSDYDSGDEEFRMSRQKQQMQSRAEEAVCYMVKFKANNSIITNRGCAKWLRGNNILTCESLNFGDELQDCQLCNSNGCNKLVEDDGSWVALWSGGEKVNATLWLIVSWLVVVTFGK